MSNGEQFISMFNKLDNLLRDRTKIDREKSFTDVIESAAKSDVTVRRRKEKLLSFGRLRNAIIHDRDYPEKIIADPRPEVIEEFKSVLEAIRAPHRLIPRFQRHIKTFKENDSLNDCLRFMKENDFSQVVVEHEGKYLLLSTEGIVKWLENARDIGLADLEGATVVDALVFEDKNIYQYLSRNDPVDAAFEMFEKAIKSGIPRLQAILITENGKPQECPLGIVTPWDLLGEIQ